MEGGTDGTRTEDKLLPDISENADIDSLAEEVTIVFDENEGSVKGAVSPLILPTLPTDESTDRKTLPTGVSTARKTLPTGVKTTRKALPNKASTTRKLLPTGVSTAKKALPTGAGTARKTESAVTQWSDGTSTENGADVTISLSKDENIAAGTVVTLTATGTAVSGYAIVSQTNTGQLTIADVAGTPITGVLSIGATTLDREVNAVVVVVVTVDDTDDSSTGTVTLSITVNDLNEHTPTFTAPSTATHCVELADNSAANTAVYTVSASDNDATENTPTFAIGATGNTGTDYAIDASTGAITVANALDMTRTPTYALVVTATDTGTSPGMKTGTVTISVTVGGTCSSDNGVGAVSISIIALLTTFMMSLYNVM